MCCSGLAAPRQIASGGACAPYTCVECPPRMRLRPPGPVRDPDRVPRPLRARQQPTCVSGSFPSHGTSRTVRPAAPPSTRRRRRGEAPTTPAARERRAVAAGELEAACFSCQSARELRHLREALPINLVRPVGARARASRAGRWSRSRPRRPARSPREHAGREGGERSTSVISAAAPSRELPSGRPRLCRDCVRGAGARRAGRRGHRPVEAAAVPSVEHVHAIPRELEPRRGTCVGARAIGRGRGKSPLLLKTER